MDKGKPGISDRHLPEKKGMGSIIEEVKADSGYAPGSLRLGGFIIVSGLDSFFKEE